MMGSGRLSRKPNSSQKLIDGAPNASDKAESFNQLGLPAGQPTN